MKAIHKKRLLNVARACRETEHVEDFDMGSFGGACGSPACALGNYAFSRNLQRSFRLIGGNICDNEGNDLFGSAYADDLLGVEMTWNVIKDHFGLHEDVMDELFEETGCGGAKTNIEAAEYIENFVAQS
jgi:hypothetical protein